MSTWFNATGNEILNAVLLNATIVNATNITTIRNVTVIENATQIENVTFLNATLSAGATLTTWLNATGNEIRNAVLVNATLVNVTQIENSTLQNATLRNSTLENATLNNSTLIDATLRNATLRNATLSDGARLGNQLNASGNQILNAVLVNATLVNAMEIGNTTLRNATLRNSTLENATLQSSTLVDAIVGVGNTQSLDMNGKTLKGLNAIQFQSGENIQFQMGSGQCILFQNGSAGQVMATCDGGAAGFDGVALKVRGHIEPDFNNTFDLGRSERKFRTLYAVGLSTGDAVLDDQVVLRASGNRLSWYSYDPQTKKLVEKVMELDLATGDLKVKGRIYENTAFEPLTEEEKRTPFGE